MAESIITPKFRGCFVGIFRASRMKDQPDSKPKFSIRAAFEPGTDLSAMKKAAESAVIEKWGNSPPKNMRNPFRKNIDLDNPVNGVADDAIIMTFSANEDRRPGVVDANVQDIIDEAQCYSGAYYRAQVRAYAYDTAGNKGVAFGLSNVQKLADGEPLGGSMPASKAFTPVDTPPGESASGMFDIND